ncbi:class I SAM-dependent methyltransferase [Streptomyces sp. NPDC057702]|uniref:class I SAM-dependent methyltransferase n=1 Tax=unclassified Streptomyces TaxID=2593676 RepID=UPI0036CD0890
MDGASEDGDRHGPAAGRDRAGVGVQRYYARNAALLGRRYESVTFAEVHGGVLDLLPPAPARVVDIGAGTGRDAAALAALGYQVTAVEPVPELRQVAGRLRPGGRVRWVADALPELPLVDGGFDLALLSAVWMHLPPPARGRAMARLAEILAPGGLLVISLRRGAPPVDREMFDVPAEEVAAEGERAGLRLVRSVTEGADRLGRAEVWWQSVVLGRDAQ